MDSSLDKIYLKAESVNVKLPELLSSKVAFSTLQAIVFLKQNDIMVINISTKQLLYSILFVWI